MKPEIQERLDQSNIRVMAKGQNFCVFVRDGCLAMVPWDQENFTDIGSTGISLDRGLAYLILRNGQYWLAGNDFELAAIPDQVQKILLFSADLKCALGLDS